MAILKQRGTRLSKLKGLEKKLVLSIETCDEKNIAALSRQYRETIREIEEIEGTKDAEDDIGAIIERRKVNGKPGAVRKSRTQKQ